MRVDQLYGIDQEFFIKYKRKYFLYLYFNAVYFKVIGSRCSGGICGIEYRLLQFHFPVEPVEVEFLYFKGKLAFRLVSYKVFNKLFGMMNKPEVERNKQYDKATQGIGRDVCELSRYALYVQGAERLSPEFSTFPPVYWQVLG